MSNATGQDERLDFPKEELRILEYWDKIDAFNTSLKLAEGRPEYTFLDGPPFATGLPHYGHILAGTIKDVVTRYASLNGYRVERRFGWDCHGLPIEFEIDKKLEIKGREDVMKIGIEKYNAECRAIVMRYSSEWEETVKRMARWIDFRNDFKTMYPSFMESVWWVFRQLFDKNQIYRGFRVMPYSTACNTPLSNFEVQLNYKDVQDPAVYVELPLVTDPNINLIIWTTTPWTLPSNLAVCVHPSLSYCHVRCPKNGKVYIIAEALVASVMKAAGYSEYSIEKTVKGAELEGLEYIPIFDFFINRKTEFPKTFTVVCDEYVSSESGTGLVHQAPAFGEDDFNICMRYGITKDVDVPCPIDDAGRFTSLVNKYEGQFWKDCNNPIIKEIEASGRLFHRSQIMHSYPHCWRSDTPLIYRAIPCWFVRVTNIIPQMLEAVSETNWVPDFVKDKRFHSWLVNARDWAISRNRYWGCPIPIWASDDFEEIVCIGSVEELERLSGVKGITDLHRESVDGITIPSQKGKGTLKRVDEVLDCWFESGSVPYAQSHYPFENKEAFERSFPADFIAEGLDQTRGWFYTLTVLGVHLFGKVPFKNLIVNGLVLAGDGKKMSKRLKNYPEPKLIFDSYGADALRLFLINSPVVRAEPLKFKEEGVRSIVKDVLLPWYNSFRFLSAQIEVYENETGQPFRFNPNSTNSYTLDNTMDSWIMASLQSLIQTVRDEMSAYHLYAVVPHLLKFIESLTNWYIRFNRRRLKGEAGVEDMAIALNVLFDVLYHFSIIMAPFTPLFAENLYLRLSPWLLLSSNDATNTASIHFLSYPEVRPQYCNADMVRSFSRLEQVVERCRTLREAHNIPLKTPLSELIVLSTDPLFTQDLLSLQGYIEDELNVRKLTLTNDESKWGVKYNVKPNFKVLGQRLKKDLGAVQKELANLSSTHLQSLLNNTSIIILGHELNPEDIQVSREVVCPDSSMAIATDPSFILLLNITINEELRSEGLARELVNRVQRLRKKAGLKATDEVKVNCLVDQGLANVFEGQMEYLCQSLKSNLVLGAPEGEVVAEDNVEIGDSIVRISLSK